jgi:hypothetical protein
MWAPFAKACRMSLDAADLMVMKAASLYDRGAEANAANHLRRLDTPGDQGSRRRSCSLDQYMRRRRTLLGVTSRAARPSTKAGIANPTTMRSNSMRHGHRRQVAARTIGITLSPHRGSAGSVADLGRVSPTSATRRLRCHLRHTASCSRRKPRNGPR